MASKVEDETNLIVNYLPQTLTDEQFRSMFISIGPLQSTKIVREHSTGYSYGFGFVNYMKAEDAQRAIETLNGLPLQNKTIKVAYSRKGPDVKGANLYIANLPRSITAEQLQTMFCIYGDIIHCTVPKDKHTGLSKGIGFVLFNTREQAEVAIESTNGITIPGHPDDRIVVKFAADSRTKARPPNSPGMMQGYDESIGYGPRDPYFAGRGPYCSGGPMRSAGMGRHRYNPMSNNSFASGPPQPVGGHTLFVYNIGNDADESILWQLFAPFGAVLKVNVIMDREQGLCKGYGFVTMANYTDAVTAISGLNGFLHGGKKLQVSFKS